MRTFWCFDLFCLALLWFRNWVIWPKMILKAPYVVFVLCFRITAAMISLTLQAQLEDTFISGRLDMSWAKNWFLNLFTMTFSKTILLFNVSHICSVLKVNNPWICITSWNLSVYAKFFLGPKRMLQISYSTLKLESAPCLLVSRKKEKIVQLYSFS